MTSDITVYTTKTCAYCAMVKQFLTFKGKKFKVVDLDEDLEARKSIIEKTGVMSVPITQVGDQYVIGWNRTRLAEVL